MTSGWAAGSAQDNWLDERLEKADAKGMTTMGLKESGEGLSVFVHPHLNGYELYGTHLVAYTYKYMEDTTMSRTSRFVVLVTVSSVVSMLTTSALYAQCLSWFSGGLNSRANGISSDGSTVIGEHSAFVGHLMFRWEKSGTVQHLSNMPGSYGGQAFGVSADGSVVVGKADIASGGSRAFRWTTGGMQDIGTLSGYIDSEATGVSGDGSVIVGAAYDASGNPRAFRWTAASGGMQDLGTLGGTDSFANGVSADGSTVVGWAATVSGTNHAFLWTSSGGMQDLGTLQANSGSYAAGVSADGSVVVGTDAFYKSAGFFGSGRFDGLQPVE